MTGTTNNEEAQLHPRLLYIGDVPVESSYHGSALLYRLLQTYPADRLMILEAGLDESLPTRRLPGVKYAPTLQPGRRWLYTRMHSFVASLFTLLAPYRVSRIQHSVGEFRPDAILTVAHGFSWIAAARYARRHNLPLHLIVHDDWPRAARLVGRMNQFLDIAFGRIYRSSASRLCVSPYMAAEYQRRYVARGTVLYPSRAVDAVAHERPPEISAPRPLTVAFGGSINTVGHVTALRLLAEELAKIGGQVRLYGPITAAQARSDGLAIPAVTFCGLVPADLFIERIRAEADVLFVPMSFAQQDRANMSLCFPSKLTDYTAAGLAMLIYGPAYSSAVCWGSENPGVAEIITTENAQELSNAIRRLGSSEYRRQLAEKSHKTGDLYFSHAVASSKFFDVLRKYYKFDELIIK